MCSMISSCVIYTCTCSSIRRLSLNIKSLMYRVEDQLILGIAGIHFVFSVNTTVSYLIALNVLSSLPPGNSLGRWFGEPVKSAIIHSNAFLTNAKGYPCLSKCHQKLLAEFFNHSIHVVFCSIDMILSEIVIYGRLVHNTSTENVPTNYMDEQMGGIAGHPLRFYLYYIEHLYNIHRRDFLQSPSQPIMDNQEA
ncbi:hypothetical protein GIB67_031573 [Kingdonia uniflora]|uniref:PRMT5 TIM barrel domain-containing protein n=1 Tax=Kingdonia uniflora TaxID=39325 RepID=A0A7J7PBV4_9MAGN|nr:hypothetical protein GIB67_031573 [Kingdonia uniflora]